MLTHKPVKRYRDKRTWKQRYRKSRRFDKTCRSNGGCPYCRNNRLHKHRRAAMNSE